MLLVIPFVLAGLVFSARPSLACSCVYAPMEVGPFADLVFTGLARAYSSENRVERYVVVEFDVATVYKGPPASRIQVQAVGGRGPSGGLGPGCEYGFQLGQQYTVFAKDHDSDGVPNTNGCFWNVEGPIDPATYGLESGQVPARNDESLRLTIVTALAIVALAVISIVIARRGRATP
jgi:hypothetical protein